MNYFLYNFELDRNLSENNEGMSEKIVKRLNFLPILFENQNENAACIVLSEGFDELVSTNDHFYKIQIDLINRALIRKSSSNHT